MIYSIQGKLTYKGENFFVVDLNGLSFKIRTSFNALRSLPQAGEAVNVVTHLHVREDALELFGFLDREELELFEQLISISGIGPKSALGILGIDQISKLRAAIGEGKVELLTKASGIGRKTAERIVLELRSKMKQEGSGTIVGLMESDQDLVEALANLGYTKNQAREALAKVGSTITGLEARLKKALGFLKNG